MNNVKEILKEMENKKMWYDGEEITDLLIEFGDFSSGYICDIIMEVADNNIDIYNYNLWNWAKNNEYYIEQAVKSMGMDSKNFDLMQLFQMAQYEFYSEAIYSNLSDFIYYAILKNVDAEEISDDILEEIENIANEEDSNEELETYIEEINDMIEEGEQNEMGAI